MDSERASQGLRLGWCWHRRRWLWLHLWLHLWLNLRLRLWQGWRRRARLHHARQEHIGLGLRRWLHRRRHCDGRRRNGDWHGSRLRDAWLRRRRHGRWHGRRWRLHWH